MKKLSLVLVLTLLIIMLMPVVPVSATGNEPPTDALYFSEIRAIRGSSTLNSDSGLWIWVTNPTDAPITTDVDFWVYCPENSNLKEYTEELWEIAAYSTESYNYIYQVHDKPGFYWFTITSIDIDYDVAGYMDELASYPAEVNRAMGINMLDLYMEVGEPYEIGTRIGETGGLTPYNISVWFGVNFIETLTGETTIETRWSDVTPNVLGEIFVQVMSNNFGETDLGVGLWVNVYGEVDLVCNRLYPDYRVQLIDKFVTFFAEIENVGTAYGTVQIVLYITDTSYARTAYTTKNVSFGIGDKKLIQFEAYQVEVVGTYLADCLEEEFAFWCTNDPMFVEPYDPDEEEKEEEEDDDWDIIDPNPIIELPAGLGDMAKAAIVFIMIGGVGFVVDRQFHRRWLTIIAGAGVLTLMVFIGWSPIWLTITFALLFSFYIIKKVVKQ